MLIFVDETGGNTSQIADGNIGGRKVIVPTKGSGHGTVGSTTDHHFTVLPFISGTGSAVMYAIRYHGPGDLVLISCTTLRMDQSLKCSLTFFFKVTLNFKEDHVVNTTAKKYRILSVHHQSQVFHQSY